MLRPVLFLLLILPFYNTLSAQRIAIAYRDGTHWGYADTLGNVFIKPIYDDVSRPKATTAKLLVAMNKKWGVISEKGSILIPLKYNRIIEPHEGYFITETIEGSEYLYTLFDSNGQMVIPPARQRIDFINKRTVIVSSSEQLNTNTEGVALLPNGKGKVKWIIPRNYTSIYFRGPDSVFVAETNDKTTEFKLTGTKVSMINQSDRDPSGEIYVETVAAPPDNVYRGPIDEFLITLAVSDTTTAAGRSFRLKKTTKLLRKISDTVVFADCEKIQVIKYAKEASETFYKDKKRWRTSMWAIARKNGKYGAYFSVPKDSFIPFEYDSIGPDIIPFKCETIIMKAKKNGKWGLIDLDNKVIADFLYDEIFFDDDNFYGSNYKMCFFFNKGLMVKTGDRFNILVDSASVAYPGGFDKVTGYTQKGAEGGFELFEGNKRGFYKEAKLFIPGYEGDGVFGEVHAYGYPLVEIKDRANKIIGYMDRKGILYFKN